MRFVVALACLVIGGCGKVEEDPGAVRNDASSDVVADNASPAYDVREDGCPVDNRELKSPCAIGKVCKYYACSKSSNIIIYRCKPPADTPDRPTSYWDREQRYCDQEQGPDGCPLGVPRDGYPVQCDTEGKACRYEWCSVPAEGGVVVATCTKNGDGTMTYKKELKACEAADASL